MGWSTGMSTFQDMKPKINLSGDLKHRFADPRKKTWLLRAKTKVGKSDFKVKQEYLNKPRVGKKSEALKTQSYERSNKIEKLNYSEGKKAKFPVFKTGRYHSRTRSRNQEGNKGRIHALVQGTVEIVCTTNSTRRTFTVRKISNGSGCRGRIFPIIFSSDSSRSIYWDKVKLDSLSLEDGPYTMCTCLRVTVFTRLKSTKGSS